MLSLLLAGGAATLASQTGDDRPPVVRGLSFRGNRAIDDEILRISIATSQSSFFARSPFVRWMGLGEKKYFDEIEFRRDVLRLAALYRQSGFLDATVDTTVHRAGRDVYLQVAITEGPPVRVTSFEIEGLQGLPRPDELRRDLPLQVSDPFNRLLMLASADTIRLRLADRGHPYSEVFRNFDVDRDGRRAAVRFEVDPGPPVRIGTVEIEGNRDVSADVVRRALTVHAGDRYRGRALYESQLELYRSELFTYANVALVDSVPPTAPDSGVTVRVRVAEGPKHRLRLGAGYGSIDCFRTTGSWTMLNMFGGGRSLQVRARASQIGVGEPLGAGLENTICRQLAAEDSSRLKLNYNLSASLREPYLFSRAVSGTVTLFAERYTEYLAYLRQAVGGEVGVTVRARRTLPITVAYGLSYGSTKADVATYCMYLNVCTAEDAAVFARDLVRATIAVGAARDHRNSALDPTRGSWVAGELRYASPAIGSDTLIQFTKAVFEISSHHPIGRRQVLSLRLKLGTILPATLGFSGQELKYVPTEERFYAGGASSVRGYGQNELGPIVRVLDTVLTREEQVDGEPATVLDSVIHTSPTGGNSLFIANAEVRFPLPGFAGRLSGAVFLDAGRVYNRATEVADLTGLRITPGFGVRVTSPLGPVRLDIALNPYPVEESPLYAKSGSELVLVSESYRPERGFLGRFRLHLSVGQPF